MKIIKIDIVVEFEGEKFESTGEFRLPLRGELFIHTGERKMTIFIAHGGGTTMEIIMKRSE